MLAHVEAKEFSHREICVHALDGNSSSSRVNYIANLEGRVVERTLTPLQKVIYETILLVTQNESHEELKSFLFSEARSQEKRDQLEKTLTETEKELELLYKNHKQIPKEDLSIFLMTLQIRIESALEEFTNSKFEPLIRSDLWEALQMESPELLGHRKRMGGISDLAQWIKELNEKMKNCVAKELRSGNKLFFNFAAARLASHTSVSAIGYLTSRPQASWEPSDLVNQVAGSIPGNILGSLVLTSKNGFLSKIPFGNLTVPVSMRFYAANAIGNLFDYTLFKSQAVDYILMGSAQMISPNFASSMQAHLRTDKYDKEGNWNVHGKPSWRQANERLSYQLLWNLGFVLYNPMMANLQLGLSCLANNAKKPLMFRFVGKSLNLNKAGAFSFKMANSLAMNFMYSKVLFEVEGMHSRQEITNK